MKRELPSLNALRAFEAAARHSSFVGAAEELAVTPAAVSHQIRSLEDHFGASLFQRHHRAVELTPVGRRLLPGLTDAFDRLTMAVNDARPRPDSPVTVSVASPFAAKWLAPRLEGFFSCHPDIPVQVQPDMKGEPSESTNADLAVFLADPDGQGVGRLFEDQLFPVCAPVLRMSLKAPANLSMQTILHDSSARELDAAGWSSWLRAVGMHGFCGAREQYMDHGALVMDAALHGLGVALARGAFVASELRTGTLVRPFDVSVSSGRPWCLLSNPDTASAPGVMAFRNWLLAEASTFRSANPRLVH
ncbi:LysR family transcriptional regulator [Haematospirillum jordaniae]|uniref:HTH lysR-type domain-containing protein n=1 Tax=Haematospirillum jordaniae TaxID=1549855 RepID=A0A143DEF3_9PROT|nr:LysR family transcriptional regulator [Haematospirillum jordaniae]AMW35104.1 hypothetical protein AY555_07870 [Haematospirillum jordaniae]NKD44137.1 LysR family transcriptional regulator [Haematospirillum jordaniae]NKD56515.1 LysR family transcriptional regulator [Haematospirillum jordaniae]NKD58573.1 LysR family transcriptional regulator [Haematospirillum jordaniae]NKD66258.1 LysR family transcriptional regulator [Haematospirillum jordaniae]